MLVTACGFNLPIVSTLKWDIIIYAPTRRVSFLVALANNDCVFSAWRFALCHSWVRLNFFCDLVPLPGGGSVLSTLRMAIASRILHRSSSLLSSFHRRRFTQCKY